ncbi:zinc CCCH type domain-containing protein [Cryptosporidium andersoni]|uniref:Zinc CCCH type domain-containing protein n=1 Tax=Cryptosporidium andersoni TaxID=117008 RepID=A0A1J4MBB1_9CRYT|nr:zinc CCCH type domain-containing protein [Cryptosporidium andersoni]
MDTETSGFLWSLADIENDCPLCLRHLGLMNNISKMVLPCCQQVVCESCFNDEMLKSNNSCPFCLCKGIKGQKLGNSNNVTPSNTSTNTNSNPSTIPSNGLSVGAGSLPLDLSCWLPQNLTAICNPGHQSNCSSTSATSPYYKSNSANSIDNFPQDSLVYIRGNSSTANINVGTPNTVSSTAATTTSATAPFGSLSDGFWNHSPNSTSNTTASNINGSSPFMTDPWLSSGTYSPSSGFLHDFNCYDNNANNPNNSNIIGEVSTATGTMNGNLNGPSGSNNSDIYHNNSMYTWTVHNPMNNLHTFTQANHGTPNACTIADVDFQRFCFGLGIDISDTSDINNGKKSVISVNSVMSKQKESEGFNLTGDCSHNIGLSPQLNPNMTSFSDTKGGNSGLTSSSGGTLGSNSNTSGLNNISNSGGSVNSVHQAAYSSSAFPPLTSATIRQNSSKDTMGSSGKSNSQVNIANFTSDTYSQNFGTSVTSPHLSSTCIPGSNQNVNNNNPVSTTKLISMLSRSEVSSSNGSSITSVKGTTNSNSHQNSGGGNSSTVNNVSYIDAVLHKSDCGKSEGGNNNIPSDVTVTSTNMDGEMPSIAIGANGEPYNYKRALCRHWMRGYCWLEADCKFAHGEVELRTRDGKLRHPTLTGDRQQTQQGHSQTQSQSQQSSSNNIIVSPTVLASSSSNGKSSKQNPNKSNGASYAATAASSLSSTGVGSNSNVSYSVIVASGTSTTDSKRG